MQVTNWGQLDSTWIGRRVVVRWEEPSQPLAEGLNSGVPHERRGTIQFDGTYFYLNTHALEQGPPEHAHVQEVTE